MGTAGKQEELRTESTSILRSKKEEIWQRRKYLVNAEKHKLFFLKSKMSKKLHQTRRAESRVHIYFLKKEIEGSFEVSSSIKAPVFWLKMNWAELQMTDDILKTIFSRELKKLKTEERKFL